MTDLEKRMQLVPLGPWIELCEAAGVPYVPAEFSNPFPVKQIGDAIDGSNDIIELERAFDWYHEESDKRIKSGKRFSARWECCSSSATKSAAAKGLEWCPSYYQLTCDDSRVFDCTVGCDETRLCIRPWVEPLRYDGYPVEFRVFRDPNGFWGVSNYYPQRPISMLKPDDAKGLICAAAMEARRLTKVIWKYGMETNPDLFEVGFSADFIAPSLDAPKVVFLEGGPPHVANEYVTSHPCCFAPGRTFCYAFEPQECALTH